MAESHFLSTVVWYDLVNYRSTCLHSTGRYEMYDLTSSSCCRTDCLPEDECTTTRQGRRNTGQPVVYCSSLFAHYSRRIWSYITRDQQPRTKPVCSCLQFRKSQSCHCLWTYQTTTVLQLYVPGTKVLAGRSLACTPFPRTRSTVEKAQQSMLPFIQIPVSTPVVDSY